jgi:hypothetical protein
MFIKEIVGKLNMTNLYLAERVAEAVDMVPEDRIPELAVVRELKRWESTDGVSFSPYKTDAPYRKMLKEMGFPPGEDRKYDHVEAEDFFQRYARANITEADIAEVIDEWDRKNALRLDPGQKTSELIRSLCDGDLASTMAGYQAEVAPGLPKGGLHKLYELFLIARGLPSLEPNYSELRSPATIVAALDETEGVTAPELFVLMGLQDLRTGFGVSEKEMYVDLAKRGRKSLGEKHRLQGNGGTALYDEPGVLRFFSDFYQPTRIADNGRIRTPSSMKRNLNVLLEFARERKKLLDEFAPGRTIQS